MSEERGVRDNEGKLRWGLVDYESIKPMVEVLMYGAEKYGDENWKKGFDRREIMESMMRHLVAIMDGQEDDEETGKSHMGHIMANAMFYNYMKRNNL